MTIRSSVSWRPVLTAAVAISLVAAFAAPAQTAPITDQYRASFEVFDRELKEVIRAENVIALACLVDFPLQVVHADGSVTALGNAQALSSRYSEVFTPAVRRAILDTRPGGHFFTSSRIAYLNGVVWVGQFPGEDGDAIFRIKSINLPPGEGVASLTFVGFVCQTSKHRILVEEKRDGSARCRVWKRPKSLLEAPDLELDGAARMEGTGECRARFWTFNRARRSSSSASRAADRETSRKARSAAWS